jgi:hypothetical protein
MSRRLFEQTTIDTPADDERIALGKAGSPEKNILVSAFKAWLKTLFHSNEDYKIKVIEIGNWNMYSDASVQIAHELTAAKIINVSACIRLDSDILPSTGVGSMLVGTDVNGVNGGQIVWNSTNVILGRTESGRFDNTNYDESPLNRGHIIIHYLP